MLLQGLHESWPSVGPLPQTCHACGKEPLGEKLIAITVCACCCIPIRCTSPSAICGSSPISPLLLLVTPRLLLHLLPTPLHLTGCGLKTESSCRLSFKKSRHCAVVSSLLMLATMLFVPISAAHQILSCQRSILVTSGSMRLSHS